MIFIVYLLIAIFILHNYNKHYMETRDASLQGFFEYMKVKYWNRKEP